MLELMLFCFAITGLLESANGTFVDSTLINSANCFTNQDERFSEVKIMIESYRNIPALKWAGECQLECVGYGKVRVEFSVTKDLLNRNKVMHGGITAALFDMLSCAAGKSIGRAPVTVNLNVSYISGAKENDVVVIEASVDGAGNSIITTSAQMYKKTVGKEDKEKVATAQATLYGRKP